MTRQTPTPPTAREAMRDAHRLAAEQGHRLARFAEHHTRNTTLRTWRTRCHTCYAFAYADTDGGFGGRAITDPCGSNLTPTALNDARDALTHQLAAHTAGQGPAPETDAEVIGRTHGEVMVRLPALHPHRILTIPDTGPLAAVPKGEAIRVAVSTPIVPSPAGWSATITPTTQGATR